jgi:hypothetical protein
MPGVRGGAGGEHMRGFARRLFASLIYGDGRFYVAGCGIAAVGMIAMAAPTMLVSSQSVLAGWWGNLCLVIAGQFLEIAAGFVIVLPIWRRRKRDERLAANQCPSCGYDLRASPERCPECGTVPEVTT